MFKTIAWTDEGVILLDQRLLPEQEVYLTLRTAEEVAAAIRTMAIRGAPAIGVAAAMGIALGFVRGGDVPPAERTARLEGLTRLLASTRPTAVNLFWAIERMRNVGKSAIKDGADVRSVKRRLLRNLCHVAHNSVAGVPDWLPAGRRLPPAQRPNPSASLRP